VPSAKLAAISLALRKTLHPVDSRGR